MSSTRTAVKSATHAEERTGAVAPHLQRQLANAFVLYANLKHYHWQTFGPLFQDLHLMFDSFAGQILGTIDELAERIRILGLDIPMIELRQMQEAATVHSARPGQTMREMLEEAHTNSLAVIKEMRGSIAAATAANDPGTADTFTRFIQIHEKQEWFLRQALQKRDGLTA
jgi:starvation-inducible DNA-binding protein